MKFLPAAFLGLTKTEDGSISVRAWMMRTEILKVSGYDSVFDMLKFDRGEERPGYFPTTITEHTHSMYST